jgi:ADP-ribosyl-[dinitrogen reductase] hydrolase
MLLGMATGDACGFRFENLPADEVKGLLSEDLEPGKYTDDTQQALAVSELMISDSPFNEWNLSKYLLMVYQRDKREGYSQLTRKMLEESPDPDSFLSYIPENEKILRKSDGAAMRALPLGFFARREDVISYALKSAAITHGHQEACAVTVAIASIAYERYHFKTPFNEIWWRIRDSIVNVSSDTVRYCDKCANLSSPDREVILESHRSYGVPYTDARILLGAVLCLLKFFGEDQERVLREALLLGGDTDTTAAIVLGIALLHVKPVRKISDLINGLENGRFGRSYLEKIGDMLSERYPPKIISL